MGFLEKLGAGLKAYRGWKPQTLDELDAIFDRNFALPTHAGIEINESLALNLSAVWCAVLNISQTVAMLPLKVFEKIGEKGKNPYPRHSLYQLLHEQPNPQMTAFTWRERAMVHLLLWGNHYSEIFRNPLTGRVISIWPFNNPGRMELKSQNGKVIYEYKQDNGIPKKYTADKIFHIPGFGYDGRIGYSVITMARNSLGNALASDEAVGRVYQQGGHLRGYLKAKTKFHDRETAIRNIRDQWQAAYGGVKNTGKTAILEDDVSYEQLTMSPEDYSMLNTRAFNITEVARWYNIPSPKLQEHTHSTYSNIEELERQYATDCISPWLKRLEQEYDRQLLTEYEKKRLFVEHNMNALLRGDAESRNKAYGTMRQHGVLSADEWRALENMNPLGGRAGKIIWQPLNMIDARDKPEPITSKEPPPEEIEEKSAKPLEVRSQRSITERRRISESYKAIFRSSTKEILKRDRKHITQIVNATLKERGIVDFNLKIDEYYDKSYASVRKLIARAYIPMSEEIYKVAANEVNADEKPTIEFQSYTNEFIDKTTVRYTGESKNEIKKLAQQAQDDQKDVPKEIGNRLDEWDEKQPDKVADRETIDGENGLAQYVYFANGFRTQWVAIGDSCPYCQALDGRVISSGGMFLAGGMPFEPAGAPGPLSPSSTIRHPAAHQGCDCSISATL